MAQLDELLWSWPSVVKAASTDFERGFALSIMKQSRRKGWRPTPKQLVLMETMVAQHYRRGEDDDLIEGDA